MAAETCHNCAYAFRDLGKSRGTGAGTVKA
jgi:hypothetical protein